MKLIVEDYNDAIVSTLYELLEDLPVADGLDVTVLPVRCDRGLAVECCEGVWRLEYENNAALCRGLTLVAERAAKGLTYRIEEKPAFETLGVMLDMTEAAVLNIKALKRMVRLIAAEGYNALLLRTVKGSALNCGTDFDVLCGGYGAEEIVELEGYAARFGVTLVPHIQLSELTDTENACEIADKVLCAVSENLSGRKICLGFDRPALPGCGPYATLGEKFAKEELSELVNTLSLLCEKYGFEGTIGGADLLTLDSVPQNLTVTFSECTAVNGNVYREGLAAIGKITYKVGFVGGDNSWYGPIPLSWLSHTVASNTVPVLVETPPKEVYVAMWRDDCEPCPFFSTLPTIFTYGEGCWEATCHTERLSHRMLAIAGVDFYDMVVLEDIPAIRCRMETGRVIVNPAKYMLYDGMMNGSFHGNSTGSARHLVNVTDWTAEKIARSGEFAYVFEAQVAYSALLAAKAEIENRVVRKAYPKGDREALETAYTKYFDRVEPAIDELERKLCAQWDRECKSCGFELVHDRLELIRERCRESKKILGDYLEGKLDKIEAYEGPIVRYAYEEGLIHDRDAILFNDFDAIVKGNN